MTWEEQRWIREHRKRLVRRGAPRAVVDRWEAWLAAVVTLPASPERDMIAEQLDDPEAPLPWPRILN